VRYEYEEDTGGGHIAARAAVLIISVTVLCLAVIGFVVWAWVSASSVFQKAQIEHQTQNIQSGQGYQTALAGQISHDFELIAGPGGTEQSIANGAASVGLPQQRSLVLDMCAKYGKMDAADTVLQAQMITVLKANCVPGTGLVRPGSPLYNQ
jgi:hypothetical protein